MVEGYQTYIIGGKKADDEDDDDDEDKRWARRKVLHKIHQEDDFTDSDSFDGGRIGNLSKREKAKQGKRSIKSTKCGLMGVAPTYGARPRSYRDRRAIRKYKKGKIVYEKNFCNSDNRFFSKQTASWRFRVINNDVTSYKNATFVVGFDIGKRRNVKEIDPKNFVIGIWVNGKKTDCINPVSKYLQSIKYTFPLEKQNTFSLENFSKLSNDYWINVRRMKLVIPTAKTSSSKASPGEEMPIPSEEMPIPSEEMLIPSEESKEMPIHREIPIYGKKSNRKGIPNLSGIWKGDYLKVCIYQYNNSPQVRVRILDVREKMNSKNSNWNLDQWESMQKSWKSLITFDGEIIHFDRININFGNKHWKKGTINKEGDKIEWDSGLIWSKESYGQGSEGSEGSEGSSDAGKIMDGLYGVSKKIDEKMDDILTEKRRGFDRKIDVFENMIKSLQHQLQENIKQFREWIQNNKMSTESTRELGNFIKEKEKRIADKYLELDEKAGEMSDKVHEEFKKIKNDMNFSENSIDDNIKNLKEMVENTETYFKNNIKQLRNSLKNRSCKLGIGLKEVNKAFKNSDRKVSNIIKHTEYQIEEIEDQKNLRILPRIQELQLAIKKLSGSVDKCQKYKNGQWSEWGEGAIGKKLTHLKKELQKLRLGLIEIQYRCVAEINTCQKCKGPCKCIADKVIKINTCQKCKGPCKCIADKVIKIVMNGKDKDEKSKKDMEYVKSKKMSMDNDYMDPIMLQYM